MSSPATSIPFGHAGHQPVKMLLHLPWQAAAREAALVAEPQEDKEQPMSEETKIDPKHGGTRLVLRTLGPALAGLGLFLVVIGVGSLFSTPATFTSRPAVWPLFLGIPLLFVGVALCMMGFRL